MAYNVKPLQSYTSNYFKNPYKFGKAKVNDEIVDLMAAYATKQNEVKQKRSMWDRIGDQFMIGVYPVMGFLDGVVDRAQGDEDAKWYTPYKQAWEGFAASSAFGKGDPDSEYTFSKVLENVGWKPESTIGKVAKGTVGFVGDVLLDPTTYLSGGVSAIVKGSGRTAKVSSDLASFADDARHMEFDNTVARLQDKGISSERAEKFATRKFDLASKGSYQPKSMTQDMAKSFVEYETRKRGNTVDYTKLDSEAKEFANKWNELRGIRDAQGGNAITLGVANLPFGQYIAPKMGVFGKTLQLSDGVTARKIGDKLMVSTVYSKTRDSLYGSKMGKLFSTNAAAQKLSRENPSGLYELLKFSSYERGLVGDKLAKDKAVRAKAREMNFTEAETSSLLKSLEDKTILNKVKQTIKFSETAKAKEVSSIMEKALTEMKASYSDVTQKKTQVEYMKASLESDLGANRDIYRNLKSELRNDLSKIDVENIRDVTEKQKVVDLIKNEIDEIDRADAKILTERGFSSALDESPVVKRINELESLVKEQTSARDKEFKDIKEKGSLDTSGTGEYRTAIDAAGQERKIGMYDNVTDLTAKRDLVKEISKYAFGRDDALRGDLMDGAVEPLSKMIKSGSKPSEIRDYVASNGQLYGSHLPEVYKYVASQLGYKSWDEAYVKPMEKLEKSLLENGKHSSSEQRQLLKLRSLSEERHELITRLYDDMTEDEFKAVRLKLSNQDMLNDLRGIIETDDLSKARNEFVQSDDHLDFGSRLHTSDSDAMRHDATMKFLDKYNTELQMKNKDKTYQVTHPVIAQASFDLEKASKNYEKVSRTGNPSLIEQARTQLELAQNSLRDAKANNPRFVTRKGTREVVKRKDLVEQGDTLIAGSSQQIESLVAKMSEVMKEHFPNQNYNKLSKANKQFVVRLSSNDKLRKQLQSSNVKKGIADEAQRKADVSRINAIVDTVKPGHTVYFKNEGDLWKGTVEKSTYTENGTLYHVKLNDGSVEEIYARDINKVGSMNAQKTVDELVDESPFVEVAKKEREELDAELGKALSDLEGSKLLGDEKKRAFIKEGRTRLSTQRERIKALEKDHTRFRDTLDSMDSGDEILMKIAQHEKVLADDDALETYFKSIYGAEEFEKVLASHSSVDVAKVTFDSNLTGEERVNQWVDILRREFDAMGQAEVGIGKLTDEQFRNMVGQYLPHILTEEGKAFIESAKGSKMFKPGVTSDLGYGQKWNPYRTSRNLEGNVQEINAQFSKLLKGKNLFSENMSEIYLTRALKHNELMYDDAYMRTMMDTFGKEIADGVVEDGYKAVVNIGHLKEKVRELVRAEMGKNGMMNMNEEMYSKYTASVLNKLGFPANAMDDIATPMVELTEDQIMKTQHLGIARQVNEVIVEKANRARKLQISKDQSRFLGMYDKFLHWTKLMQTTIMPHFHIRNKMSNLFQNWLSVGKDGTNPRMQVNAHKALRSMGDYDKLRGLDRIDYVDINGNTAQMGWDELVDIALVHGVVDTGVFAKDIGAGAASTGLFRKAGVSGKYDITDTRNFIGFKKGGEIGAEMDNADRLVQLASLMRQGKTPLEAADQVKKYLFDYSDLTAFEQGVMKRILPYYTWLRKNGKLQMQQVVEQPGKYRDVEKVLNGVNGMNNQEDRIDQRYQYGFAQDWVQLPQSDKAIAEGKKPIILNPFLPFMDLNQVPTQGWDSVNGLLSQVASPIRAPLEIAFNKNVFFDSEITHEELSTGENIGNVLRHLVLQTAPGSAIDGVVQKDGEHLGRHIGFLLTGVKTLRFDEERSRSERIYDELYGKQGMIEKVATKFADGLGKGVANGLDSLKPSERLMGIPQRERTDYSKSLPELEAKIKGGDYTEKDLAQLRSIYMQLELRKDEPLDESVIDKKIQDIAHW